MRYAGESKCSLEIATAPKHLQQLPVFEAIIKSILKMEASRNQERSRVQPQPWLYAVACPGEENKKAGRQVQDPMGRQRQGEQSEVLLVDI